VIETLFTPVPVVYRKAPGALKDYGWDLTDWLGTDVVTGSTWQLPAGLTKVSDARSATVTTIWLSGGVKGRRYDVFNTFTTLGGRIEVLKFTIVCDI
jgi:hypothetical protein